MKYFKFDQGVYTKKDFEPKRIFRSPSIKGNGGKNKGKKYYTKNIDQLFKNIVWSIALFCIAIFIISATDKAHTKKFNEIMSSLNTEQTKIMDEFKTHVVKAEGVEIIYEQDGKGVEENNETVEESIRRIAKEENFKWPDYLVKLAKCESSLNPKAVNIHGNKPSTSKDRGLFQLNDYWHKHVSDSQAFDIDFSTRYTIKLINEGKQGLWVCNNKIK